MRVIGSRGTFSRATSGDEAQLDAYFPFGKALEAWGRSFARMGIRYRGSTMTLDLLERPNKYSNGFCHWPRCAYVRRDHSLRPSSTNFTSLCDPLQTGSGRVALKTRDAGVALGPVKWTCLDVVDGDGVFMSPHRLDATSMRPHESGRVSRSERSNADTTAERTDHELTVRALRRRRALRERRAGVSLVRAGAGADVHRLRRDPSHVPGFPCK